MQLRLAPAVLAVLALSPSACAQWTPLNPITKITKEADGVRAAFPSGAVVKLEVCSDAIIHLRYSPTDSFPNRPDYVVVKNSWEPVPWSFESVGPKAGLSTKTVKVTIEPDTGAIAFSSAAGQELFRDVKRLMTPESVNGDETYRGETVVDMYGSHEG